MDVLHKSFPSQNKQYNKHCLRLVQQNYRSEFEKLSENENEISGHQKCTEFLLIEVYKYLIGQSPEFITLSLSSDKIRITSKISKRLNLNPRTKIGPDSIADRASQLLKNVDEEIRNSGSLLIFKESMKKVPLFSCSWHCC